MKNIICISGGLASAWVAIWAKKNIENPIFYFNDTKWEHKDLYRFLNDLEQNLNIKIFYDSDGRTPEEVFYDQGMLGSNRVPLCSKILKAERLQKFVSPGDVCFFGIDRTENHRAVRISDIYSGLGVQCRFPLIDYNVTKEEVKKVILDLGIKIPELYSQGFTHNNCGGGCVRAGRKSWALLLKKSPEVFEDRARVEREFSFLKGKKCSFMKDETLDELKKRIESQINLVFDDEKETSECIGICSLEN